jgi:hypothetical protein
MSKLKKEEAVYTPRQNMPRTKIFRELCKDPDFPCRDCTRRKDPLACVAISECPEYYKWFSGVWRQIQKALRVEKPKTIMK